MTQVTIDARELSRIISWSVKGLKNAPRNGGEDSQETPTVHVVLSKNTLSLSAYNDEDFYSARADVTRKSIDDTESADVLVAGSRLQALGRTLKAGNATVDFTPKAVNISSGRGYFTLPFSQPKSAVKHPGHPAELGSVSGADFKAALAQVTPAASNDETLLILTAVLLEFDPANEQITLVATDRYQLSSRTIPFSVKSSRTRDEKFKITVSARSLKKMLGGLSTDEQITLLASSKMRGLGLNTSSLSVILQEFAGEYVRYEPLLKFTHEHIVFLDRQELKTAISDLTSFGSGQMAVNFHMSEGTLTVSLPSNEGSISLDIEGYNLDSPQEISFAPSYLSNALSATSTDVVGMKFNNASKPVVFKNLSEGEVDNSFTYLVMPRR